MKVHIITLLIYLVLGTMWDLKERTIPTWLCVISMFGVMVTGGFLDAMPISERIGGMIIGVILLVICKLTRGQIGEGDGITFLITGFAIGFWNNCLLLFEALFLSFLWSLLFLAVRKINLQTRLPFLPFVLMAFVSIMEKCL